MKTTNSKGTREAGHQSQAQRRKVISSRENEKPKAMRKEKKTQNRPSTNLRISPRFAS